MAAKGLRRLGLCWFLMLVFFSTSLTAYQPQTSILPKEEKIEDEIGIYDIPQYISDLQTFWNYGSLYYNHINKYGTFGATVNYYYKFNAGAEQYQIQAYPKFSEHVYLDLELAYAKKSQYNFPSLQYLAQAYINEGTYEFSFGQGRRAFSMFENQNFYDYIVSFGDYFGNYFAWIRLDHYTPRGVNLYSIGLTRYLDIKYHFLTINANIGKILDIGDLPPLDQKVIANQKGVNLYYQYSIADSLYMRLGVGYTLLNYKSIGLTRVISNIVAGFLWRF